MAKSGQLRHRATTDTGPPGPGRERCAPERPAPALERGDRWHLGPGDRSEPAAGVPTEHCLRVSGIIGRPPNGNNNHSIEERSGSATNWSWMFASSAAGWNPVLQVWTGRSNVHRFAWRDRAGEYVYLERDVVYRLEWSHRRTGAYSRVHEVRIYDAAGELLDETPEFRKERWEGWASLAGFSAPYNGLESGDGLQLVTNGTGWNAPCDLRPARDIIPMWYYAGVAVSRTGWVGRYRGGERD